MVANARVTRVARCFWLAPAQPGGRCPKVQLTIRSQPGSPITTRQSLSSPMWNSELSLLNRELTVVESKILHQIQDPYDMIWIRNWNIFNKFDQATGIE